MLPERFDGFYLGEVEGDSLFVEACVQENGLLPFEGERTKGSVATTASVQTASAFMMGGWLGSENRYTTGMPSDGFEVADATSALFTKYERRTADGRHLEMKVMAQAIKYDKDKTYKTVWSY